MEGATWDAISSEANDRGLKRVCDGLGAWRKMVKAGRVIEALGQRGLLQQVL
jgi:hypothetical protein